VADGNKVQDLRRAVLHFLDDEILCKDEDARSKLEDLIVQTGRAFADALHRYSLQQGHPSELSAPARAITEILGAYNEVSRREVDIAAMDNVRRSPFER